MFVFPAVILAFVYSFPLIHLIYAKMIADQLGYMPSIVPSGMAISQALFIGLVIPLVSSTVPIKRSLAKNLSETLDVWRGKNKGTTVKITDSKVIKKVPFLAYGTAAVILGISVYYGLPVAIL